MSQDTNDPKSGPEDAVPSPLELTTTGADPAVSELVETAKNGDAEALNDLFGRHYDIMVEMARRRLGPRLRSKEDAEDLAQTTFREATRDFSRYQYRGEGSLLSWLLQILQNKIRDRAEFYSAGKRDVSRERALDGDSDSGSEAPTPRYEPPADDLSVTRQVQRNEEFEILREAIDQLSDEHRTAITLVLFEGHSLREAGKRMEGRSEDAVRMLLRRAEAKVREITRAQLD